MYGHNEHSKGFTPVWVNLWRTNFCFVVVLLLFCMDRLDNGRVFLQYESSDGFSELISEILYTGTMNTRKASLRCE